MRNAARLDDVGRVAASGAFGVVGVNRAAFERRHRVFDESRFVERIGVDRHLNVVLFGYFQAAVDGGRRRAPVLVELQSHAAGRDLLDEALRQAGVALAEKSDVHRDHIGRLAACARCSTVPVYTSSRWCPLPARFRRRSSW